MQVIKIWLFSLITIHLAFALMASSSAQRWNSIEIDPLNGKNIAECGSGNVSFTCKNLTYAFKLYRDATQFVLYPGDHYLSSGNEVFQNTAFLSISPLQAELTTVFCLNNSGLSFVNVTGVNLVGIHFIGCGAVQPSTNINYTSGDFALSTQRVGIFFNQCKDVNITEVTISDGDSATGAVLYNTVGNIVIADSSFLNNCVDEDSPISGGGGMVVEFSYCNPGDNLCP